MSQPFNVKVFCTHREPSFHRLHTPKLSFSLLLPKRSI